MFTKLVRIGRDAELRTTANGKSVIGLACVYDIGWGDNKKAQWLECSIWGKQAEGLAAYLLKGKQIVINADDLEVETFTKGDGTTGSKLKCRAVNIDLTDNKDNQQQTSQPRDTRQQAPRQQAPQAQQQQAPPTQSNNQDDNFDDDIPF